MRHNLCTCPESAQSGWFRRIVYLCVYAGMRARFRFSFQQCASVFSVQGRASIKKKRTGFHGELQVVVAGQRAPVLGSTNTAIYYVVLRYTAVITEYTLSSLCTVFFLWPQRAGAGDGVRHQRLVLVPWARVLVACACSFCGSTSRLWEAANQVERPGRLNTAGNHST